MSQLGQNRKSPLVTMKSAFTPETGHQLTNFMNTRPVLASQAVSRGGSLAMEQGRRPCPLGVHKGRDKARAEAHFPAAIGGNCEGVVLRATQLAPAAWFAAAETKKSPAAANDSSGLTSPPLSAVG
jgi:hypothetical protein